MTGDPSWLKKPPICWWKSRDFLGHGDNANIMAYVITNIFFGSEHFLYTVITVSPAVAMVLTGKMTGFSKHQFFLGSLFSDNPYSSRLADDSPGCVFLNFESDITDISPCLRQGSRAMVWGFHFPFNQSQSWRSQHSLSHVLFWTYNDQGRYLR